MTLSIGILVDNMARIFWADVRTVRVFARHLREAGLLTTGGRGPSAPAMTPRDAATIMLALLVTDRPARAVDAVKEFGGHPFRREFTEDGYDIEDFRDCTNLFDRYYVAPSACLIDVLEHVIKSKPHSKPAETLAGFRSGIIDAPHMTVEPGNLSSVIFYNGIYYQFSDEPPLDENAGDDLDLDAISRDLDRDDVYAAKCETFRGVCRVTRKAISTDFFRLQSLFVETEE